jgi:hypothetical protein
MLIKQCIRCFIQDKKDVIKREIAKLLDAAFIKEVYHLDWLANLVLVSKKNKYWSMCVDYTDLNKACKKRSIQPALNRSSRGVHDSVQPSKLSTLLLGVSLDSPQS